MRPYSKHHKVKPSSHKPVAAKSKARVNKKFERAFEELHSAALNWGAFVHRMEKTPEYELARKRLQVAGYEYYTVVLELALTKKPSYPTKNVDMATR